MQNSKLYLKQGTYTIDKSNPEMCLGQGSFGKVYKGFDTVKNIWVAIKQINIEMLEQFDQEIKQVILNEINVMRKFTKKMNELPCQYLVKQYECFRSDKFIYIVMEYCHNGTLFDELKVKKTYFERQVIEIARQLLQALVYLEKMSIAHRDLKPQNIFISEVQFNEATRKVYKIGDFGFAAQKTSFTDIMGTYQYMAPEVFQREQYTTKVDVWSLGITLHQLLFSELYYSGKNKWEIQDAIKSKPYKLSEDQCAKVSKQMQNFLTLCLTKDKFQRPLASDLINHQVFNLKSSSLTVFDILKMVIQRCSKLIQMASMFQEYQVYSGGKRKTIFIQLYLLKFSYCEMNRTAYSIMNKENYMNLPSQSFEQLINIKNQKQFQELNKMSQQIWNQSVQLFTTKYNIFVEEYLPKFSSHDQQLIQKVINNQPYEDPVLQVFVSELKKWTVELNNQNQNQSFQKLKDQCEKIVNSFQQSS